MTIAVARDLLLTREVSTVGSFAAGAREYLNLVCGALPMDDVPVAPVIILFRPRAAAAT